MERPEGCRFWEAEDVVQWIRDNVPLKDRPTGAEDAAIWWKALATADVLTDLNTRELAEICMDGVPPTSMLDITEELQAPHLDDQPTPVADADADVESALIQHFGLLKED